MGIELSARLILKTSRHFFLFRGGNFVLFIRGETEKLIDLKVLSTTTIQRTDLSVGTTFNILMILLFVLKRVFWMRKQGRVQNIEQIKKL